jgi:acetyl esterase/lipase
MTSRPLPSPLLAVQRVADMQLRGRAAPLATRVYWPSPCPADRPASDPAGRRPPLVVLFPGTSAADAERADALSRGICSSTGVIVLALLGSAGEAIVLQDGRTALAWAADHAAELGADERRLVVAGRGDGAVLAAAVALDARAQGWPDVARQVLICPTPARSVGTDTDPDAGLDADRDAGPWAAIAVPRPTPATVVAVDPGDDGAACAARLRQAGVRVDELRYEGLPPGDLTWAPWGSAADLVVTDLARALQHRLALPPTAATEIVVDDEATETETDETGTGVIEADVIEADVIEIDDIDEGAA